MKKIILLLLALNIVGAFLAGCASDPAADSGDTGTAATDGGAADKASAGE